MQAGTELVAQAIATGHQVLRHGMTGPDPAPGGASRLDGTQVMARSQIVTPFSLNDGHYAFSVGFDSDWADLDDLADVMAGVAVSLRPLLRRALDEESIRLFRRALDACSDPVIITEAEPIDLPGPRIVYANRAFEVHSGYTFAEVAGLTPRILQSDETSAEARANIREALAQWKPVRQEILNTTKTGEKFWTELQIAPVADESGWYTHWIAVQRDVTESRALRQSEKAAARELESLFAVMPGTLLRAHRSDFDRQWQFTYASPNFQSLTGYPSAQVVRPGWLPEQIETPDLAEVLRQQGIALDDSTESAAEFHFQHRNGDRRLFHARMRGFTRMDGSQELILLWSDITRERAMQTMSAQTAKLAQLGELATGMAHELNQPLAVISMAAQNAIMALGRGAEHAPRAQGKLETIIEMAHRASGIIDHMRVFGRVDQGALEAVALEAAPAAKQAAPCQHRLADQHPTRHSAGLGQGGAAGTGADQSGQQCLRCLRGGQCTRRPGKTGHRHQRATRWRPRAADHSGLRRRIAARRTAARIPAVLHHQGGRQRHRAGIVDQLRHHRRSGRQDHGGQSQRRRAVHHHAAGGSGRCGWDRGVIRAPSHPHVRPFPRPR